MQDSIKTIRHEQGILEICLNRPQQLNALNHILLEQLDAILTTVKSQKDVKAILLTGSGKGFCAGADINELLPLDKTMGYAFAQFGQQVFRKLELLGKPSLAALHGFAFGGGCELAMAATLRFSATGTLLGQPEIKLGIIPGFGGTQRLSRFVGPGRALELCLTGRRFSAEDALAWGLVNELTTPDNLIPRALSLLSDLSQLSVPAMQSIITAVYAGYNLPMEEALHIEAEQFSHCCTTADKQEGVKAFLEKRSPQFGKMQ